MDYSRITPRARSGTTGISEEADIAADNAIWITPPDRVAAVTVAVHIPVGATATYKIEACCNRAETIGSAGTGGYWNVIEEESPTYTVDAVKMIANAVTALRVTCTAFSAGTSGATGINVCFVG
jgi:hypothetical protein